VAIHWDGRLLHQYKPFRATWKGGGTLWRLSAPSRADVWAFGSEGNWRTSRPVVVRWDGLRWTRLPTPPLPKGVRVRDFAATGPDSAWLVGGGTAYDRPLVMHWNGRRWGLMDLRWSVARSGSELLAITARAPNEVWAVGVEGLGAISSFGYGDLVLRWSGRHWQRVASPLAEYGSGPYAIAAAIAPSGDLWTANQDESGNTPLFVRFPPHGQPPTWNEPQIDFSPGDIDAVSSTGGWVAGVRDSPHRSVLVHWSGKTWRIAHIPHGNLKAEPDWSLSALSPTDVWAAGGRILARYSC
jgi:hypothetical protein